MARCWCRKPTATSGSVCTRSSRRSVRAASNALSPSGPIRPTLPLGHVEDTFALLGDAGVDVVLGPAYDGGYYLIGLRTPHAELFTDIPWSTDRVFAKTLHRAETIGLRARSLPACADVDTFTDLAELAKTVREDPDGAPRTRAVLSELGLL